MANLAKVNEIYTSDEKKYTCKSANKEAQSLGTVIKTICDYSSYQSDLALFYSTLNGCKGDTLKTWNKVSAKTKRQFIISLIGANAPTLKNGGYSRAMLFGRIVRNFKTIYNA